MSKERIVPAMRVVPRLCMLLAVANSVTASTHWIVTEGGKIQAQADSIFHMKRPYDLVAFLQQERRVEQFEVLRKELEQKDIDLTEEEQRVDFTFETTFFENDKDCQAAEQPLTEFDLFISTLLQPDSWVPGLDQVLRQNDARNLNSYNEPHCSAAIASTIPMKRFEVLMSPDKTENLELAPEKILQPYVLEGGRFHLAQYGHLIQEALQYLSSSDLWLPSLLASSYWRIKGRAREAVQCLRPAIIYAPDDFKHYGLLALANIYHRTRHSEDAVIVLKEALRFSSDTPVLHFTLGNVYATLMQFREAEDHFKIAWALQPTFNEAKLRRHAVRCHRKLERGLEEQSTKIEITMRALKKYKELHEAWSSLLNDMANARPNLEARVESRLAFEQLKIQGSRDGRGQDCVQSERFGQTFVTCNIHREQDAHQELIVDEQSNGEYLDELLRNFQFRLNSIQGVKDSNSGGNNESEELKPEDQTDDLEPEKPSLSPKYNEFPALEKELLRHPYLTPDWPTLLECSSPLSNVPKWNEYPSVFLSPENKGFDIERLMGYDIDIPMAEPAPLPWYPPFCKTFDGFIPKYDNLPTIRDWTHITVKVQENEIEAAYHKHSPEKNFHEWGARVNRAMELNLEPKWIVYLLAGTYWRIWGHPQNVIHCYRHALSVVPRKFRDVVLTNFAALLYKTGALEEALTMLTDALTTDDKDPDSNFLMANLYSAKGNMTGALYHYRRALIMRQNFSEAIQFMHVPACQLKFHSILARQEFCDNQALSEECLVKHGLEQFGSLDTFVLCSEGHCNLLSKNEMSTDNSDRIEKTRLQGNCPSKQVQTEHNSCVPEHQHQATVQGEHDKKVRKPTKNKDKKKKKKKKKKDKKSKEIADQM